MNKEIEITQVIKTRIAIMKLNTLIGSSMRQYHLFKISFQICSPLVMYWDSVTILLSLLITMKAWMEQTIHKKLKNKTAHTITTRIHLQISEAKIATAARPPSSAVTPDWWKVTTLRTRATLLGGWHLRVTVPGSSWLSIRSRTYAKGTHPVPGSARSTWER